MDEVEVAIDEVACFNKAGGDTLVELSCIGLGRDVVGLKKISEQTGVNIIASTGFYREVSYPEYVKHESAEQLATRMIEECTTGIDGTGIRPGIFAELATEYEAENMSPLEQKVFTAVAYAQAETHLPISTHCWAGHLAFEQIETLTRNGVPPNKIIIGHLGVDEDVKERVLRIADKGVYLGIDTVGYQYEQIVAMKDLGRVKFVKELIDKGYLRQITISQDLLRKLLLKHYHGIGYDHLLLTFVPMLRDAGVQEQEIKTILVDNPKDVFS